MGKNGKRRRRAAARKINLESERAREREQRGRIGRRRFRGNEVKPPMGTWENGERKELQFPSALDRSRKPPKL